MCSIFDRLKRESAFRGVIRSVYGDLIFQFCEMIELNKIRNFDVFV